MKMFIIWHFLLNVSDFKLFESPKHKIWNIEVEEKIETLLSF